jgi:hypothetical protein
MNRLDICDDLLYAKMITRYLASSREKVVLHEIHAQVDPLGRCDPANAALVLQKSPQTLANWRVQGLGPAWFKVNGRVYYWLDDLKSFGCGDIARAA